MSKKPVALIIMDGFGINNSDYGNAISAAKTPNLDKIFKTCPMTQIGASGMDVGLPDGQMGNSEVGHTNIGAGRIVYQELTRITKSIRDGDFSLRMPLKMPLQTARRMTPHSTLWDFFPTAGFTATMSTFTACWSLPKERDFQRFMFIALWTAGMFLRHPERIL